MVTLGILMHFDTPATRQSSLKASETYLFEEIQSTLTEV